jgi:hypothetical protein
MKWGKAAHASKRREVVLSRGGKKRLAAFILRRSGPIGPLKKPYAHLQRCHQILASSFLLLESTKRTFQKKQVGNRKGPDCSF